MNHQKVKISIRLLIIIVALVHSFNGLCQKINAEHYSIIMTVSVAEKTINVQASIRLKSSETFKDSLKMLMHKGSVIKSILIDGKLCNSAFIFSDKPANRYMPESRELIIYLPQKINRAAKLEISYITKMDELKQNNSSFTNEWISLASYSSWYPVNFDWGNYSYDISVTVPVNFKVSGTGNISQRGNKWKLNQPLKTYDMVLVISDKMKTKLFKDAGSEIRLDYVYYPQQTADGIINSTSKTYSFFKQLFGPIKGNAKLTIVSTPERGNSAFSRKNFIYMQTKGEDAFATNKTISHEIAHIWWNKASSNSWQDWLNEGFAEFSTLLFVKETYGDSIYQNELLDYREFSKTLPPVWEMDRNAANASAILYRKVPVILADFMNYVGQQKFYLLLKQIHTDKILLTDDLLILIEKSISIDAREKLIKLLKM